MENLRKQVKTHRRGDPLTCQRIWDAIKQIRIDRRPPTSDNIIKYCCRSFNIDAKTLIKQIQFLLQDTLLVQKASIPVKGSNKGVEQPIFCIPVENEVDLGGKSDWYCFECHKPGEVLSCGTCPRVFHMDCVKVQNLCQIDDKFACPICQQLSQHQDIEDYERAEMNLMLSFACSRLEEKLPVDDYVWNPAFSTLAHNAPFTTDRCAALLKKIPKQTGTEEDAWRAKFLLRSPITLSKLDDRADRQVYKSLEQFRVDCATLVHNIIIFHGEHSPIADSARVMQRDCLYELEEMKLCPDCYKRSNKQEEKDWFCQPCSPPHELVYAKAKGYPYWPAKVLKIQKDIYDVRFFGVGHDRATLDKSYIRPITFDILSLVAKRSSTWVKAMEELRAHQLILSKRSRGTYDDDYDSGTQESNDLGTKSVQPKAVARVGRKSSSQFKDVRVFIPRVDSLKKLNKSIVSDEADSGTDSLRVNESSPVSNKDDVLEDPHMVFVDADHVPLETLSQVNITTTRERSPNSDQTDIPGEIEKLKKQHADEVASLKLEIQNLKQEHENQIALIKKKPWCVNCWNEGLLYCCSNVNYCSVACQKVHWKSIHKRVCKHGRERSSNKEK